MFIKSLLLLLAASVLSAGRILPQPETRIFGGEEVNIESAPWQVHLRFKGLPHCGGSIYSETIIITAAHCLYNKETNAPLNAEDLTVLAGSANKWASETVVKVAAIKSHNEFNSASKFNDIGIVKLSAPLDLTTKKMRNIELAIDDPAPGTKALVTGWGDALKFVFPDAQFPGTYSPNILQGIEIQIQKTDYCNRFYGQTPKTICAGTVFRTTCGGDSGGPLVVDKKLAGVVSFGTPQCTSLTVYTSVSQFRDWIKREAESI